MRTIIHKDGKLAIISDTELESFALDAWAEKYKEGKVVLQILTDLEVITLESVVKEIN
jgi:hypothetical protein